MRCFSTAIATNKTRQEVGIFFFSCIELQNRKKDKKKKKLLVMMMEIWIGTASGEIWNTFFTFILFTFLYLD
jgi:hypothetical protein